MLSLFVIVNLFNFDNEGRAFRKMPNIKSAKKRVKVIATKTARNKAYNSSLKTAVKKASIAVAANATDKVEFVRLAVKKIDKAVAKGILHKNTASRKKSALARKLNSASV